MKMRLLVTALSLTSASAQGTDLLQIYELATHNDPTVQAAEANRNAALENRPQGIARLLPQVQITGGINQNWSTISGIGFAGQAISGGSVSGGNVSTSAPFNQSFNFWDSSARVSVQQPLYHRDYWVQLSQADSQIAEAEAKYASEQQKLILRTSEAYFGILLARDSLVFAEAEQRAIGRQLDEAKARFDVGLVAITDVHEAQAGYDQAVANAIKADNELNNKREALREIVGEFSGELKGLREDIPLNKPIPEDMESWNTMGQENNLAIIAAASQMENAQKNIELQFAGHYPTVDIVGSSTFTDNNRPQRFAQDLHTVGMQVTIPVFSGGGVNSRVRQARSQLESAQDTLDGQRRTVRRQIKDSYRGIISAISGVQALKAAVTSAQSAVEASEAGFQVGTRTMVDVLTAQKNLYRAKRDYSQARNDYVINSLKLREASSALRPDDLNIVNGWLLDLPADATSSAAPAAPATKP